MSLLDTLKQVFAPFVIPCGVRDPTPPALADGDVRPFQLGPNGGLVTEAAAGAQGTTTPAGSVSSVAAQGAMVCWQVPVTTTARALLKAWVAGTAYTLGEAVLNDSGKMYVCITAGTAAGSGGPTGTSADITDNTAHWSFVTSTPSSFRGSLILRNEQTSTSPFYYGTSAALAPAGAELPQGAAEPCFITNGDPTTVFVACVSAGTARATVVGYQ